MTTTGLPRIPARKGFRRWWEVRLYRSDAYVISLLEQADDDRWAGHESVLGTTEVPVVVDHEDPDGMKRDAKQKLYEAAQRLLVLHESAEARQALKELTGSYPPKTWIVAL